MDYQKPGEQRLAMIYDGAPIEKLPWYAKLEGYGSKRHSPVFSIIWGCYGLIGLICCISVVTLAFLIFILPVITGAI